MTRRLLRQALTALRKPGWTQKGIRQFGAVVFDALLGDGCKNHMGLTLHFTEIYLEELAKVSRGEIAPKLVTEFVAPFVRQLTVTGDCRLIGHIARHVFGYLLHQSDEGLEYQEKFECWRQVRI